MEHLRSSVQVEWHAIGLEWGVTDTKQSSLLVDNVLEIHGGQDTVCL